MKKTHPDHPSRERLQAFVHGRLSNPESSGIEAHLLECQACCAALATVSDRGDAFISRLCSAQATSLELPSVSGPPDATAPARGGEIPSRIAHYEILGELGRGGMGVVYKARDVRLKRLVALKVILAGEFADPQRLARFRLEAQAVARLRHPHIVQLLEVGDHAGRPFLVLEYVDGGTLRSQYQGRQADPRTAARLVQTLAEAVQHAHQHGIIHRDLKPANVLLAFSREPRASAEAALARGSRLNECVPKITDFGLAKIDPSLSPEAVGVSVSPQTQSGELVGTPNYMAPEQAEGKRGLVGTCADIYALGSILYELLTGRPPFAAATAMETLLLVLNQAVVPPRRWRPQLPGDLEVICLKCLQKEPAQRYTTAAALAEDLGRFLQGEPIQARPVGSLERLGQWARRRPAIAGLLAAVVASLVVGSGVSTYFGVQASSEARMAKQERDRAQEHEQQALQASAAATAARNAAQQQAAEFLCDRGVALAERGQVDQGLFCMLESLQMLERLPLDLAENASLRHVVRVNLGGWSSHVGHVRQILSHAEGKIISSLAFHPGGQSFVAGSRDGTIQVYDGATGQPKGRPLLSGWACQVSYSHDGRMLFSYAFDGTLRLWEAATGRALEGPLSQQAGLAPGPAWNPTRKLVNTISTEGVAQLWDATTGQPLGPPWPHPGKVRAGAFSSDGQVLLLVNREGTGQLWDVATRQPLGPPLVQPGRADRVAFSPDGRTLVLMLEGTSPGLRQCFLWDRASNTQLPASGPYPTVYHSALFSPDSKVLVTTTAQGLVQRWEVATGQPLGRPLAHPARVTAMAFTPDGAALVTAGADHLARVWDLATGLPAAVLRHEENCSTLAFDAEGRLLLTGTTRGSVRLWELPRARTQRASSNVDIHTPHHGDGLRQPLAPGRTFSVVAYSPDRHHVLLGNPAQVREVETGQPLGTPPRPVRTAIGARQLSPDGRIVVTASHHEAEGLPSIVQLWEARTGRPLGPPLLHSNHVTPIAFRPDGQLLAAGTYHGRVHLWELTGAGEHLQVRPRGQPWPQGAIVWSLAFSPDGQTLAVGTTPSSVETSPEGAYLSLWDVASGQRRGPRRALPGAVTWLQFSPDGTKLLSCAGFLQLWQTDGLQPLAEFPSVIGDRQAGFSPNGQTFLTGIGQQAARLWDAATGELLPRSALPHASVITALAFSSNGQMVLVVGLDGSARLWDTATHKPLGPPVTQGHRLIGGAFLPGDRSLVTTAADGSSRVWPVPTPLTDDPALLVLRLTVRSGVTVDGAREVIPLAPAAWARRRQELLSRDGTAEALLSAPLGAAVWHDARAREAEASGDLFAALWHLERLGMLQPQEAVLRARRARVLHTAGQLDQAAAAYGRAEELGLREALADEYHHKAVEAQHARQWSAALWYLNRALAARPRDWQLYERRAAVFGELDQPAERAADLARAVELDADATLLCRRALECATRQEWSEASAWFARARRRGPLHLPYSYY